MKSRHVVRTTSFAKILLLVLTFLFALCVGPANSAPEPGTVTIVLQVEPSSLDPVNTGSSDVSQVLQKNVLESLTELNPDDSRILPALATSWKQIDTNTWHFILRKGVKFHDGKEFNAEAVIFNIKRLYDKRITSVTRKFFTGIQLEGKALDSHTLEVKTDKYEPLLPTLIGIMAISSPATPMGTVTRNPIGTGPYKFVKWDPGTQIVLERFDGYWGKQPQVKKGIYLWRKESAVRAAMVQVGEADFAPNIATQDANRPGMDYSYFNSETTVVHIHTDPPLDDKRIRTALNLAIDRNGIRGSILSKDVVPATQLIVPNIFGYNPALKVWPYDPQKAKQLVEEARKSGVAADKEILLVGRSEYWPGGDELMEAITAMWKAVGLNVKLRMFEPGARAKYNDKPYPKEPYLMQNSHDNSKGDAVFTLVQRYTCNGVRSQVCDKELDTLIDKGQVAAAGSEERRKYWQAAFKSINEDLVADVLLFHMIGYSRVGNRINFKPSIATNNEVPLAQMTFK